MSASPAARDRPKPPEHEPEPKPKRGEEEEKKYIACLHRMLDLHELDWKQKQIDFLIRSEALVRYLKS